jgi:hypothetical protein
MLRVVVVEFLCICNGGVKENLMQTIDLQKLLLSFLRNIEILKHLYNQLLKFRLILGTFQTNGLPREDSSQTSRKLSTDLRFQDSKANDIKEFVPYHLVS